MKHSNRLKTAIGAGLLLALAACGGSSSNGDQAAAGAGSSETGVNSGQIASDSFLSQVVTVIGASSEATEPGGIDAITATTPDTTNPYSIM